MSLTDPIADMLTRIRNANMALHEKVDVPSSRLKVEIARVLKEEGFIKAYKVIDDKKQGVLRVYLKYGSGNERAIAGLRRASRPGLRVYTKGRNAPQVRSGAGVAILSTPKGVLTDRAAREEGVGGEILCYVW